jgi:hypothetical protein
LDQAFEHLAREFLSQHPEIPHEWRQMRSRWWRDRVDLVCGVGAPNEVFATLHGHQIAVGPTKGHHDDFEDFGRGLSDEAVAREAFDRFVEVLAEAGYLEGK